MKAVLIVLGVLIALGVIGDLGSHSGVATSRSSASATACSVSDIAVDKLRARTDADTGYTRITGLLTNHCTQPSGPQVKITVYDKAGEILKVDDMWPASINNIPANTEFPFEWMDKVPGFSRFTISVTSARTWGVSE